MPAQEAERAVILILRFVAAARDTGDACCWDAALDLAESAFGEDRGPVVVGHAGALMRRLAGAGADIAFLPPPCRRLSSGETLLLGELRRHPSGQSRPMFGSATDAVAALAQSIRISNTARQPRTAWASGEAAAPDQPSPSSLVFFQTADHKHSNLQP